MTDFEPAQRLFEHVVNKSYLTQLSDSKYCKAIPFKPNSEDKEQQVRLHDLRWVKISKLVLEKGIFTPDQLSMVYSALHPMADTIAILLKKEAGVFSLYLGVRDFEEKGSFVSFNTLKYALNGFFPGVAFDSNVKEKELSIYPSSVQSYGEEEKADDVKQETEANVSYSVSGVSGVGALKDDRKQFFIQGLEKLIEGSRAINNFSVLLLAERIDSEDARRVIDSYSQISSSLIPLSQRQISLNQTGSESVTDTLTKSFSDSVTRNLGTTTSCGTNHSKFRSSIDSIGVNLGGSVGDGKSASANLGIGYGHSWVKGESDGYTDQWGFSESLANTYLEQDTESKAKMKSWAEGITHQFTFQERTIKLYVDLIDKQIKRLDSSIPYGLWNMASYCIVNDSEERSKSLAAIFKGAMVGDDSDVDTVWINYWKNSEEVQSCLEKCVHPRFKLKASNGDADVIVTPASVVSSKELAIMMPFPQHSVPGIIVREQASFGRNVELNEDSLSSNRVLTLGSLTYLGQEDKHCEVGLNIPLLTSHTFVTGTTGSGKTNTVFLFLSRLPENVNFLVIEPAKGEYKDVLSRDVKWGVHENVSSLTTEPAILSGDINEGVNVFGTNPDYCELLKLNPFSFCKGIHVFEHIESIVQIFNACWPMYAAMPVVLKRSIEEAYRLCGWDLAKNTNVNDSVFFPTIGDVVLCMNRLLEDSKYSSDTKSDYRGALETRLLALSEGLLGEMFTGPDFIDERRLYEQRTIVDLSRIDNPETKALLMGILVHKLKEWRMCHGGIHSDLKHITVLEEAHHLLRKTSITQNQEGANIAGKAVEMLVNGIAEMRSFGEGFVVVDQTPSLLDSSVIRNTNTKIILNLPDYEDRLVVGKSIGLNDNQIIELGKQKCGYAIVNQSNWEEPVQCKIDEYRYNKEGPRHIVTHPIVKKSDTAESIISQEVLGFLLNKRLRDRPSFQVDRMRDSIMSSDMSSLKKNQLISLFEKYSELPESQKDDFFLWQSENFDLLAQTVSEYVGLDKEFEDAIRRDCTPIAFDLSINRLVESKIPGVSPSMRLNLQHCILRSLKKNKEELNRFKAWYLRNRK